MIPMMSLCSFLSILQFAWLTFQQGSWNVPSQGLPWSFEKQISNPFRCELNFSFCNQVLFYKSVFLIPPTFVPQSHPLLESCLWLPKLQFYSWITKYPHPSFLIINFLKGWTSLKARIIRHLVLGRHLSHQVTGARFSVLTKYFVWLSDSLFWHSR